MMEKQTQIDVKKSPLYLDKTKTIKLGLAFLVLVALVFIGSKVQAADDYLSAIDMEVEDLSAGGARTGGSPAPAAKPAKPVVQADVRPIAVVERAGVPEDVSEFEVELLEQFPGTYLLYMKLDEPARQQVFAEFEASGKYSSVRQKIIALNVR